MECQQRACLSCQIVRGEAADFRTSCTGGTAISSCSRLEGHSMKAMAKGDGAIITFYSRSNNIGCAQRERRQPTI